MVTNLIRRLITIFGELITLTKKLDEEFSLKVTQDYDPCTGSGWAHYTIEDNDGNIVRAARISKEIIGKIDESVFDKVRML